MVHWRSLVQSVRFVWLSSAPCDQPPSTLVRLPAAAARAAHRGCPAFAPQVCLVAAWVKSSQTDVTRPSRLATAGLVQASRHRLPSGAPRHPGEGERAGGWWLTLQIGFHPGSAAAGSANAAQTSPHLPQLIHECPTGRASHWRGRQAPCRAGAGSAPVPSQPQEPQHPELQVRGRSVAAHTRIARGCRPGVRRSA